MLILDGLGLNCIFLLISTYLWYTYCFKYLKLKLSQYFNGHVCTFYYKTTSTYTTWIIDILLFQDNFTLLKLGLSKATTIWVNRVWHCLKNYGGENKHCHNWTTSVTWGWSLRDMIPYYSVLQCNCWRSPSSKKGFPFLGDTPTYPCGSCPFCMWCSPCSRAVDAWNM